MRCMAGALGHTLIRSRTIQPSSCLRRWQHAPAKTRPNSHFLGAPSLPLTRLHNLTDSPEMNSVLSAYPMYADTAAWHHDDVQPLGPRPGDEAILTLSGGVDSSVAAFLAITRGGLIPARTIFMRNWNSLDEGDEFEPGAGGSSGCQWMRDWERVERMAAWLGVKAQLVDLSTQYWTNVFSPSLDQWQKGLTPNPDVLCNSQIKFGELLRLLDAEEEIEVLRQSKASTTFAKTQKPRRWLVTGHYAHVDYFVAPGGKVASPNVAKVHGRLLRAQDSNKDQSYFLSGVSSIHLGRSHFPLANVCKQDVREFARRLKMPTAESEESMGICFVGKRNKRKTKSKDEVFVQNRRGRAGNDVTATQDGFAGFLHDYIDGKPGDIVTLDGGKVGRHSGLHTFTIGQGAKIAGACQRYFVAAKDVRRNCIVVVPDAQHAMLQCTSLRIDDVHVVCAAEGATAAAATASLLELVSRSSVRLYAQIRHRQEPIKCRVELSQMPTAVHVVFDEPVSSVAEGQVCALYDGSECLGSGVISAVETLASTTQSAQQRIVS